MKLAQKLLTTISVFLLASCTTMDVDYLDDNYSDRVELAQKILGIESVYFDTSSYNKEETLFVAIPVTEIKNTRKIVGGGVSALVEQFELVADSFRKIAVSGNRSSWSAKVILNALARIDKTKLAGVQLLYIGNKEYQLKIKQAVENKGAEFMFVEIPETSI